MVNLPNSGQIDPVAHARAALQRSRLRAEVVLSAVRIAFCVLVIGRFLTLNVGAHMPETFERGVLVLPATLGAMAFSVWVARQISRRRNVGQRALATSVLLDTIVCTVALASNVLWPWPTYRGLLVLPDAISILVMIMTAGFRISFSLAIVGAIANGFGFAVLTLLDLWLNPTSVTYGSGEISLYVILLLSVAAVSVVSARRTETLVLEAARQAYKTSSARRGLSEVLQEHHDAQGLLSAALFGVDKLNTDRPDARAIDELRGDLEMLRDAVSGIREQALAEVTTLDDAADVDVQALLRTHRLTLERACSPVQVSWQLPSEAAIAQVTGGEKTLSRALMNLLTNAKEGDGRSGASHCHVALTAVDANVTLVVEDDGPGLNAATEGASVKARGTGSGLKFVRQVALASGGTFELSDTGSGARATLVLSGKPWTPRHPREDQG